LPAPQKSPTTPALPPSKREPLDTNSSGTMLSSQNLSRADTGPELDGAGAARITKLESDVAEMKGTLDTVSRTVKDMQLMLQQIYLMSSRAAMEAEESHSQNQFSQ
jgi:uncharacterized coiled-coil protein SlyX